MKLKMKYAAGMQDELERLLGCSVEVVEDREAQHPCKMEYARNYGRDRHVVRVNPARCVSEYPVFMMMLAADVVLKEYPDAVEDMKRYLSAAAVEGAALSHEELLAIYPEFVVTANRRMNLLFAMKCGEVCGKKLIDVLPMTYRDIAKDPSRY